ncbi:MAG: ABC transporter ATP-binding protein [Desulfobacterales bacterium]|nr:ABC transporter ATP-binding protein [Desulfobacterales bacterium]
MIDVKNLSRAFGRTQAITDVSFTIKQGEIVGFLGPNGAGKTTTLRILTGYLPPGAGTAKIAGFDIQTQSLQARQHIGYMPESAPLYKYMTVLSFLRYFGSLHQMPRKRRDARITEVMRICEIDDFANTQISKLSKGYKQLVSIARAILHEPDVLILDEPTIGIDVRHAVRIREMIQSLGQHHTVLLSSHLLHEVSMICEKVIIINQGKIVAMDTVKGLSDLLDAVRHFEIEASGNWLDIKAALESADGVTNVTVEGEGSSRIFKVICASGMDIRDKLSSVIVSRGFQLRGLKESVPSLEDIFLKLTRSKEDV